MLLGRFMMLPEANCNSQTRKSNVTIVIVWWLNKSLLVWHYSIWGTRKNQQKFCLNWGLGGLFVKRCLGSSQFRQKSNFHQFFESIILTTIFLFLQHFPPFDDIFFDLMCNCASPGASTGSRNLAKPIPETLSAAESCFLLLFFLKLPAAESFFLKLPAAENCFFCFF